MRKELVVLIFGALLFLFFNSVFVSALSVSVHVPEKYTEVVAGERFYFEIEIKYPENPARKDLRLEYEIRNENNELISSAKVLKAVENQASFIDFIVIPEVSKSGFYTITVRVSDYDSLTEDVGSSFYVVVSSVKQITTYFFILLGVMFFVMILVIVQLFRGRRR